MNHKYLYLLPWMVLLLTGTVFAGNPDRQGEAGANQLLVNPWARSAGLHTMGTANVTGAEAMFLNVAGLSRINKTQLQLGHTRYLVGSDINMNALGFAQGGDFADPLLQLLVLDVCGGGCDGGFGNALRHLTILQDVTDVLLHTCRRGVYRLRNRVFWPPGRGAYYWASKGSGRPCCGAIGNNP